ncbi:MAG: hypothetical protein QM346_17885 [Chloroflexota bacterium]|nr:hypothetical protein [Chloroflexota bacterium]
MTDRLRSDITPTERAVKVTLALASGETLTQHDVARLTDCQPDSGYRILRRLSRIIPIYEDDDGWRWLAFED